MKKYIRFAVDAIKLLKPDATAYTLSKTEVIDWEDNTEPFPTKEEIDAKVEELWTIYQAEQEAELNKE
jgi:hypothetical protein